MLLRCASTVTPATVPAAWRTCCRAGGRYSAGPTWQNGPTTPPGPLLEYACHVRDVFTLFDQRLNLMLRRGRPRFENWDQDRTAVEKDYASADPAVVSAELTAEGERIAASFAAVREEHWGRTGPRSNGSVFTVLTRPSTSCTTWSITFTTWTADPAHRA